MIFTFFSILPCAMCLLMLITYLTRTRKNQVQKFMTGIAACGVIYLFADACFISPTSNYTLYLIADLLAHFFAPVLLGLVGFMLYVMHKPNRTSHRLYWLMGIPSLVGITTLVCVFVVGWNDSLNYLVEFDKVNSFPSEWVAQQPFPGEFVALGALLSPVYRLVCFGGVVAILIYIIYCVIVDKKDIRDAYRFLFKGGEYTTFRIMCWCVVAFSILASIRMFMGRSGCIDHPWVSIFISLLMAEVIYDIFYAGLITHMAEGTLREIIHPLLFAPSTLPDGLHSELNIREDEDEEIAKNFRKMMLADKRFLDPHLTIEDVANDLGTSRVVIARGINRVHNLTFREYLHRRRLDEAKHYMLSHPNATQEDVAKHSGYTDAATFNKHFRQFEGMTPKSWQEKIDFGHASVGGVQVTDNKEVTSR